MHHLQTSRTQVYLLIIILILLERDLNVRKKTTKNKNRCIKCSLNRANSTQTKECIQGIVKENHEYVLWMNTMHHLLISRTQGLFFTIILMLLVRNLKYEEKIYKE